MKRNVSGQVFGIQMITASDGSDFTSTVTGYITLDAGNQTVGGVGSGLCTHKGFGYHVYSPSQTETNGALIAFTGLATGAITATRQYETVYPFGVVSYLVGTGSTTTNIIPGSVVPAASVADQFKGRIITFDENTSTSALRGQASDITSSGAGGTLVVTALTSSPASGDYGRIT